jgi:hypothetical protein
MKVRNHEVILKGPLFQEHNILLYLEAGYSEYLCSYHQWRGTRPPKCLCRGNVPLTILRVPLGFYHFPVV